MIVDQELARPVIRDELQTMVSMLCSRFPERDRAEVERLVDETHQRLADHARIHAHLIPLTLNHCRRLLAGATTTQSPLTPGV
jgi:two-component sensor histidine kinase